MTSAPEYDPVMPDYTVEVLDEVPEAGNPQPGNDSELTCIVCGTSITYGGRGPKPKYCDEHRKSSKGSKSGNSRGNLALVERAITELSTAYRLGSQGLAFVDQQSAKLVYERADSLAESYRPLLETNKKFREFFEKTEKSIAFLPIIMAHGDLIVAIMMSRKYDALVSAATGSSDDV